MCHPLRNMPPSAAKHGPPEGTEVLLQRLTSSLAHNVNNALAGVIGYLELGRSRPGVGAEVDACLRSSVECAHLAADAVRRIVHCAGRISTAEAPATLSLQRLVEKAAEEFRFEAHHQETLVEGTTAGQVVLTESLIFQALKDVLHALTAHSPGVALTLRLADEGDQSVLTIKGAKAGSPELQHRLLEPSLMVEIQGGAVEILSTRTEGLSMKLSFPSAAAPVRRTDAPSAPAAPHLSTGLGLLRQAV